MPPKSRKHKETIDYNDNIGRWKQSDVSVDDILFQLHLRGITLTEEQEEEMSKLKTKGKGKAITKKDYLINYVERLIQTLTAQAILAQVRLKRPRIESESPC